MIRLHRRIGLCHKRSCVVIMILMSMCRMELCNGKVHRMELHNEKVRRMKFCNGKCCNSTLQWMTFPSHRIGIKHYTWQYMYMYTVTTKLTQPNIQCVFTVYRILQVCTPLPNPICLHIRLHDLLGNKPGHVDQITELWSNRCQRYLQSSGALQISCW